MQIISGNIVDVVGKRLFSGQINVRNGVIESIQNKGEPPFLLGLGAYFAIRDCIHSFKSKAAMPYELPLTAEKALMALYNE